MTDKCERCGHTAPNKDFVNTLYWECARIDCQHRRSAWSERPEYCNCHDHEEHFNPIEPMFERRGGIE